MKRAIVTMYLSFMTPYTLGVFYLTLDDKRSSLTQISRYDKLNIFD